MTSHSLKLLLVLGSAALLASCSVKEDRMECPCHVSVKVDATSDCLVSFFTPDGTLLQRKMISAEELRSGENYTKIRKGDIYVSVLQNAGDMILDGRVIRCQPGMDASPVYACCIPGAAVGEDLLVEGILQKQHSVVTLVFRNSDDPVYPYDIKVSSSYNGLDLLTLEATKGEFVCQPVIDSDLKAVFTMLRQVDTEPIYLYLLDKKTGAVVTTLDLNLYISRTGHTWGAEWLSDLNITIDYARMSLTIEVADWEEVSIFKFVI